MALWPSAVFGGVSGSMVPEKVPRGAVRGRLPNTVGTPFDAGPPQARRLDTAIVKTLAFSFILPGDKQMRDFMAWFDTTLASGTLPFDWELPEDPGVTLELRFAAATAPEFTFMDTTHLLATGWALGVAYVAGDLVRDTAMKLWIAATNGTSAGNDDSLGTGSDTGVTWLTYAATDGVYRVEVSLETVPS